MNHSSKITGFRGDRRSRYLALSAAFLGWMLAGMIMSLVPLVAAPAVRSWGITNRADVGEWVSRYTCTFLLGAAAGGLVFGWLGDRIGRAKALAISILCYSGFATACYWVASPHQLLLVWFCAYAGVGGTWPNGVALASEAWSEVSRPTLAGLMGAAANVGFMIMSGLVIAFPVTPDHWRWVMLLAATAIPLGFGTWLWVPESPSWNAGHEGRQIPSAWTVFRPPIWQRTLLGICLGAIPLMGNWGSANWLVPWTSEVADVDAPTLKGWVQWSKSGGGAVGALIGGWVASRCGRRTTYFVISLLSLGISWHIFRSLEPGDPQFLSWTFAIGFFGTLYFGWLPLFLPELFPVEIRATGSGVSFNWGRILTAGGVLITGRLMQSFDGDYARVGQITCLVYALGMAVILLAPDTSRTRIGS